ncbi:hypothetical protein ATZ33_17450 [Enterococcus silesiacus]|uniref:Uncharacterized protein n=1 Tax=Enterococcus silesiacus TaxID=332949 RepID=A0ABN4JB15_9ENTE|nr:hypothetical protein [Enterococcus silesiacus]ALS03096.1 hypothetical protein ATZ33_17450 [Enterococcus silesiacus]
MITADPSPEIEPSKLPFSFLTIVTTDSLFVAADVAVMTSIESEASTGSVVIVKFLVSPTFPVHVF